MFLDMPEPVRDFINNKRFEDNFGLFEEDELFHGYPPMKPTAADQFLDLSSSHVDESEVSAKCSTSLSRTSKVSFNV